MNTTLNIGVAGLGRLGSLYVEYLAHQIPNAEVIAITDADEAKIAGITGKMHISHTFTDYRDMLALRELDAVVIVTPTSTHHDIVLEAAERGKMVFCEKPLSISLEEAEAMKQAVDKNGIFFHMGYMRRFDPGYSAAKNKILNGEIGEPIVFKATSRDPYRPSLEFADPAKSGGIFLDMGIHDFDLARWFMGEVSEVYSIGNVLAYPEMETIGDIDNALVNLSFESGALGAVDMSRSGLYGYDIRAEIMGTRGTIQIGYLRETPILVLNKEGVTHDTVPFFMERFEKAYILQLKDFVEKACNQQEPSVTVEDGLAALVVSHAAANSFRQKTQVVIDSKTFEFEPKIHTGNK
jgi:scyllo-inositol 2-dehydrogenase (NAD+)